MKELKAHYMKIKIYLHMMRHFSGSLRRTIFDGKGQLEFTLNGNKCSIIDGVFEVHDEDEDKE